MRKILHALLLLGIILTACAPADLGVVTVTATGQPSPAAPPIASPVPQTQAQPIQSPPTLTATALPTITATPQQPQPIDYTINVLMDYDSQILIARQQIRFTNTYGQPIPTITLAVEPNRIPGAFELEALQANEVEIALYDLQNHRLTFDLPTPLEPGKQISLSLAYTLTLPNIEQGDPNLVRPQIFGVSARQVNLTDWYPMLVPYDPQNGWILPDPWYYGEHLVYPLANFDVTLQFSKPAIAPVIAASGAKDPANPNRYTLQNARTFALAMGRQLQSVSAEWQGIIITSYFYPYAEAGGQAALDATLLAVQTYTGLYGDYPHQSLAVVQGDFNDGMEFDGLYYLSNAFYNLYDGTERNYLVLVAAHETSHMWWFGRVGNNQAQDPWLDESFATYSERLFYEKNYPNSLAWWWSYRIDFYQPEGKIDGDVPSYGGFTPYMNATYRQGARFLEELRGRMGDEAFFRFLKDYYTQMTNRTATPQDFFRILETHTNADYSDLRTKYFKP